MNTIHIKKIAILATLIALMAATRMHHFGSALHLPDASLAVFLLAGFLISSPLLLGALILEAGALDYVAISYLGVDDFCVTPAYWFLIPTYAALWFAGRYYARIHNNSLRSLAVFAGVAFAALNVAFILSNGSFYLFSGRYADMGVAQYAAQIAQYYLPYVSGAVVYLIPAAILYALSTRHTNTQTAS
ncbi:MAG: hypothetical protein Q7U78_02675 [Gallionella sp.]|nr:hypothetical protein [Gallionella sp.]MDP1594933.1 hypothetical protein [Gallionella sp.]MDP1940709.1 hypothetical protein [Gallionella sp.]